MKKNLRKLAPAKVRIFKIANRRGYAALCLNNLTEGSTPGQAYLRMIKAVRRGGYELVAVTADKAKKLLKKNI